MFHVWACCSALLIDFIASAPKPAQGPLMSTKRHSKATSVPNPLQLGPLLCGHWSQRFPARALPCARVSCKSGTQKLGFNKLWKIADRVQEHLAVTVKTFGAVEARRLFVNTVG